MVSASEFERFLHTLLTKYSKNGEFPTISEGVIVVLAEFYEEYGDILEIEKSIEGNNITFGGIEDE